MLLNHMSRKVIQPQRHRLLDPPLEPIQLIHQPPQIGVILVKSDLDSKPLLTHELLHLIDEPLEGLTLILVELDSQVCVALVEQDPEVELAALDVVEPLVDVDLDLVGRVAGDDSFCEEVCGEFIGGVLVQNELADVVLVVSVGVHVHALGLLLFGHVLDEVVENVLHVLLRLLLVAGVDLQLEGFGFFAKELDGLTMPAGDDRF